MKTRKELKKSIATTQQRLANMPENSPARQIVEQRLANKMERLGGQPQVLPQAQVQPMPQLMQVPQNANSQAQMQFVRPAPMDQAAIFDAATSQYKPNIDASMFQRPMQQPQMQPNLNNMNMQNQISQVAQRGQTNPNMAATVGGMRFPQNKMQIKGY